METLDCAAKMRMTLMGILSCSAALSVPICWIMVLINCPIALRAGETSYLTSRMHLSTSAGSLSKAVAVVEEPVKRAHNPISTLDIKTIMIKGGDLALQSGENG
jgi:hypothetical protein